MRSDYIFSGELQHVLAALTPPNRIACELSLATGLRIGDCLNMRTHKLAERVTVRELKTGKTRRVYIPAELLERMRQISGKIFVFEHRTNQAKHRSTSAVYKDIKRAARLFRLDSVLQISPHSCRKVYAVEEYHRTKDLKRIQRLLNHEKEAVTIIYAMADMMTARKLSGGR